MQIQPGRARRNRKYQNSGERFMQVSLHITSINAARKYHTGNQGRFIDRRHLGVCHIAPKGYRKIVHRGVTETTNIVLKSARVECQGPPYRQDDAASNCRKHNAEFWCRGCATSDERRSAAASRRAIWRTEGWQPSFRYSDSQWEWRCECAMPKVGEVSWGDCCSTRNRSQSCASYST